MVSGGPGKDGIPAINQPRFVAARQMRLLDPGDQVFGLVHRGRARAYPQLVLVWHEIVNDRIGGERISVTYCPLTGSAFGVRGSSDGHALTFGTTGRLVNSNLLMYDRQTDSEWPQIAGGGDPGAVARPAAGHGAAGVVELGSLAGRAPRHPGAVIRDRAHP